MEGQESPGSKNGKEDGALLEPMELAPLPPPTILWQIAKNFPLISLPKSLLSPCEWQRVREERGFLCL